MLAAPLTTSIFFVEGEKCVEAAATKSFVATTVSEGSNAPWDDAVTPHFKDRHVVIRL
jgi:hypothetical protein